MTAPPATSVLPSSVQPTSSGKGRPLGLELRDVSRRYGALWALRGVSLRIEPGEFVLLRGPNGSGKSTLLRIAATLVRPTTGRVEYSGQQGNALPPKSQMGFVAHSTMLYDELSAAENLRFYGSLYGLPDLAARTDEALGSVGLAARRDSLVRTFSRGMRQRLSLARALLHAPRLLLLDEPMTGLDQQAHDWLHDTLTGLHRAGCTIVMSTHAKEATAPAGRSVWLDAGRVVRDSASGPVTGTAREGRA